MVQVVTVSLWWYRPKSSLVVDSYLFPVYDWALPWSVWGARSHCHIESDYNWLASSNYKPICKHRTSFLIFILFWEHQWSHTWKGKTSLFVLKKYLKGFCCIPFSRIRINLDARKIGLNTLKKWMIVNSAYNTWMLEWHSPREMVSTGFHYGKEYKMAARILLLSKIHCTFCMIYEVLLCHVIYMFVLISHNMSLLFHK